jgi:hypothetical protein
MRGLVSESRNVLLLSTAYNWTNAASYIDHIACYAKFSKHRFYYHNFLYELEEDFDFSPFDAIVLAHNFWPELLGEARRRRIAEARAVKLMFLQDEHQYVRPHNRGMAEMAINLMFTCVAEKDFETFYPRSIIPSLREVHGVLTGYVPEYLVGRRPAPGGRRYDVGYRSRVSPYYLGLIGREKLVIADRFKEICERDGLSSNISVHEDDRIYGEAWLEFLGACRTQLGTPSGASVVDFDGSIIEAEAQYRAAHPHATFEEVWSRYMQDQEGKVVIDTVSPRYFEYAAAGSTMVLHEGYYGGVLEPGRHYISVRKDYSNIHDVVGMIRDERYCQSLADNAYRELIESGRYSYQAFVRRFDSILDRHLPRNSGIAVASLDTREFYARQATRHDQALAFDRRGAYLLNTRTGRTLRYQEFLRRTALRLPVLGPMLRRVGGDPIRKLRLGVAAVRLALSRRTTRRLLYKSLRDESGRLERLLKDLLLLGIVKSAHSGKLPWGPAYRAQLVIEEPEACIVVRGVPHTEAQNRDGDGLPKGSAWTDLDQLLASGRATSLRLDLASVYPMQKFGNGTRFHWTVRRRLEIFRSDPDEYYALHALTQLAREFPVEVAATLRWAIVPAVGPERKLIDRLF